MSNKEASDGNTLQIEGLRASIEDLRAKRAQIDIDVEAIQAVHHHYYDNKHKGQKAALTVKIRKLEARIKELIFN